MLAFPRRSTVAQVKKAEVRAAILANAHRLFKRKGYVATTTAQIAAGARISESNLYVYFGSKFEILFAIFEPWMRDLIGSLEHRAAEEPDPRARLRLILTTLWRDMAVHDNGFTNNLMQALSTVTGREGYRPDLLRWVEERVDKLILAAVPPRRRALLAKGSLAHVLMMAQDGFSMNVHLSPSTPCPDATIELFCDLLLGRTASNRQAENTPHPSSGLQARSVSR
jgi:AcrR family transcriptional regulator